MKTLFVNEKVEIKDMVTLETLKSQEGFWDNHNKGVWRNSPNAIIVTVENDKGEQKHCPLSREWPVCLNPIDYCSEEERVELSTRSIAGNFHRSESLSQALENALEFLNRDYIVPLQWKPIAVHEM